jgi:uncharacterized membrane protein YdjX (TVP38/TMEM64 family)
MNKKYLKLIVAFLLILGIIMAIPLLNLKQYLNPEYLKTLVLSFGIFAPLVFMGIYYGLTLMFVSAAAFTIIAGLLFGKLWGSIYVVIAATLSAQTAFYIARHLGKDVLQKLPKKGIGELVHTIENKLQKNGFQSLFIMRCMFIPYIPLSYATGLIQKAKAQDFFFATLLTNMIFSPAFVFFGDSLLKGPQALILPVILIILVLLVPKIIKKLKKED